MRTFDSEKIIELVDLLGVDPDVAQQYLEMTDGNVAEAAQLFFATSDIPSQPRSGSTTPSAPNIPPSSAGGSEPENRALVSQNSPWDVAVTATRNGPTVAARLQESEQQPVSRDDEYEGVFANSIPSGRQRHWRGGSQPRSRPSGSRGYPRAQQLRTGRMSGSSPGVAASQRAELDMRRRAVDAFRNQEEEAAMLLSGDTYQTTDPLAELYRPPLDILTTGTFDELRERGKARQRWLLVNIQDSGEFECQVLNRDLWSDKAVKELVKSHFLLVQWSHWNTEGRNYANFYRVEAYPTIDVVDPRTGEHIKRYEGSVAASDFVQDMTEFLSNNSLTSSAPPVAHFSRPSATSTTVRNALDLTEEEQTALAIAESIKMVQEAKGPSQSGNPSTDQDVIEICSVSETPSGSSEQGLNTTAAVQELEPQIAHDVPPDDPEAARLQIRYPDGSREVRRFRKTDLVRMIFKHVKAKCIEAQTQPFQVIYIRKSLEDKLNSTIADADLIGASLNVTVVD